MRILVCGAAGMLGQHLLAVGAAAGHDITGLGSAELDVTDRSTVRAAIASAEPELIVNCAAWTDVDGAEEYEPAALHVNGEGAGNVAAAAAEAGAKSLFVSTDYVFDGSQEEGYVETDPTGPLSAYGRTKLEGEQRTLAANPRSFVVRTAWLFGMHGKNFVDSMLALGRERGELRVVDDQVGCPTWTRHLAEGLLSLSETAEFGIHHLAGAGRTSWYGLTEAIFELSGDDVRLEPCTTAEFPRPAPRPAFSVLRSTRGLTLPSWQEGLAGHLAEQGVAHA